MSYQNGTWTNPSDLLQKLAAWLVTQGWTIDSSVSVLLGWRMHCHKGTAYMNFRAVCAESAANAAFTDSYASGNFNAIALYGGTGYASGSDWKSQPGAPLCTHGTPHTVGAGMPLPAGSGIAYHFFGDATGDNIVVVAERVSGIFSNMYFGTSLVKLGAWTGGPYFGSTADNYYLAYPYTYGYPGFTYSSYAIGSSGDSGNSSLYVKIDVDSFTNKWVQINANETPGCGYTGKKGCTNYPIPSVASPGQPCWMWLVNRSVSQLSAQCLLLPINIAVNRDGGLLYSVIGSIPNVLATAACFRGYAPGSVYKWGLDDYMVFPGPLNNTNNSHYGFAVKKVP